MALGEETAVLGIEVEGDEAFQELESQSTQVSERMERQFKKAVRGITSYWKDFFEFLKTGSEDTRRRIEKIEEEFKRTKSTVAEMTARSGPVSALLSQIEEILDLSKQLPGTFRFLGEAIGAIATGPLGLMVQQVRDIRGVLGGQGVGAVQDAARQFAGQVGARVNAQNAAALAAAEIGRGRALATSQFVMSENQRITRGAEGRGGGRGGAEESATQRLDRTLAGLGTASAGSSGYGDVSVEREQELTRLLGQEWQNRNELFAELAIEPQELVKAAAVDTAKTFVDLEAQKQAAIQQTVVALQMSHAALMQGGPAARAAGRIVMAILAAISAQKAVFEIGEGLAAAARYEYWAAAQHFASAAQFGISAGMQLGSAVGGGGGGRRGTSAGGGAGGGASFGERRDREPRETSRSYIIRETGDLEVSDRALRRLARHIRDIDARGYDD